MRINYCLGKHPSLPFGKEIRRKPRLRFGITLPLEYLGGVGGLGASQRLTKDPIYPRGSGGWAGVKLSIRKGLSPNETVLAYAGCSFRKYVKGGFLKDGKYSHGELVITQKGVVFVKATGFLKTGRTRRHSFDFADIEGARIEERGIRGALLSEVFLVIDHLSQRGTTSYRYSLGHGEAYRLLKVIAVEKVRFEEDALVDHLRMRFSSSSKDSNSQEVRLQV